MECLHPSPPVAHCIFTSVAYPVVDRGSHPIDTRQRVGRVSIPPHGKAMGMSAHRCLKGRGCPWPRIEVDEGQIEPLRPSGNSTPMLGLDKLSLLTTVWQTLASTAMMKNTRTQHCRAMHFSVRLALLRSRAATLDNKHNTAIFPYQALTVQLLDFQLPYPDVSSRSPLQTDFTPKTMISSCTYNHDHAS